MPTLTIDRDKMMAAANKCPQVKEVCKTLWPDEFQEKLFAGLADTDMSAALSRMNSAAGTPAIQVRTYDEYAGRGFFLSELWSWELKRDKADALCLIPTKKTTR